jgi:hypothetical protein
MWVKTPVQTVRADFPHTAYRWSVRMRRYADTRTDGPSPRLSTSVTPSRRAAAGGLHPRADWPHPQSMLRVARFDTELTPSGVIGTGPAGHAPRVAARSTRPEQGSFPPAALFVAAITSTTTPSDSRCARLDFAIGLYESLGPDQGGADGPLVFRSSPCTRAAPHTPPRPAIRVPPD